MAKKEFEYEFNPIKEQKGNEQAQSVVWSTKSIEAAVDAIKKGLPLKVNPFIGNNTKLLKPELVFKRTEEEINDYIRCMQDVTYFAEKCFVMTPEGLQAIHLRDYQFEYLKHLQDNRFSIFLACRQAGKSLNLLTNIIIKLKNINNIDDKLRKKYYFYINDNIIYIELPMFEIINLYHKQTVLWKLKYHLYKIIYKLEKHGRKKRSNIKENKM